MRLLRTVLLIGVAAAGALVPASSTQAGGWAVTMLDPLPERIESGPTYTIGYWVLQHGSHPYEGDLGQTSIDLVDEQGRRVRFLGVPLREPAHFAAAVAIPHDGTWMISATQGVFAEYEIGTLTVPGRLVLLPAPAPLAVHDHQHAWGPVHPPKIQTMEAAGVAQAGPAHPHGSAASPGEQAPERQLSPQAWSLVLALGSTAGLLVLVMLPAGRRRWWSSAVGDSCRTASSAVRTNQL